MEGEISSKGARGFRLDIKKVSARGCGWSRGCKTLVFQD